MEGLQYHYSNAHTAIVAAATIAIYWRWTFSADTSSFLDTLVYQFVYDVTWVKPVHILL